VLLGLLSFALPHTPPTATGPVRLRQIIGLDALVMLKDRSYLIFMLSSMLICIPLAFYYQITSRVVEMTSLPIGQTMSYGQMSEIFFMLVMPFFFVRLGVKWMLAVGMLAWVARYALFAAGAPDEVRWMIIAGIVTASATISFSSRDRSTPIRRRPRKSVRKRRACSCCSRSGSAWPSAQRSRATSKLNTPQPPRRSKRAS
jgi:hypothetical protein